MRKTATQMDSMLNKAADLLEGEIRVKA